MGSLTISSPLAIKLRGFLFFWNYFYKKEGFLILRVEYDLKVSRIYYLPFKKKE